MVYSINQNSFSIMTIIFLIGTNMTVNNYIEGPKIHLKICLYSVAQDR